MIIHAVLRSIGLATLAGSVAVGQTHASADSADTHHRSTVTSAALWATSLMATVALVPLDRPVSSELQEPNVQRPDDLHQTVDAFAFFGGPGPFMVGSALIVAGTATGRMSLTAAGRRITESVLLAASVTAIGKGIFGRALPGVETRHEFSFGRGFHKGNGPFVSFPSGHTAAGFALAAAVSGEVEHVAPNLAKFVTPASYSAASMIAIARVYQHVHWPSDLPIAAAIGIWSGRTLEARGHAREVRSKLLDGLSVLPLSASSVTIGWSSLIR